MSFLQILPQFTQISPSQYFKLVKQREQYSHHYVKWIGHTQSTADLFPMKSDCLKDALRHVPEDAFALLIVRHYFEQGQVKHDVRSGIYMVEQSPCQIKIFNERHVLAELLKAVPQFNNMTPDQYLNLVKERPIFSYYYIKSQGPSESGGGLHHCRDSCEKTAIRNIPKDAVQLKITKHYCDEKGLIRYDLDLVTYTVQQTLEGIRIFNSEKELYNTSTDPSLTFSVIYNH